MLLNASLRIIYVANNGSAIFVTDTENIISNTEDDALGGISRFYTGDWNFYVYIAAK